MDFLSVYWGVTCLKVAALYTTPLVLLESYKITVAHLLLAFCTAQTVYRGGCALHYIIFSCWELFQNAVHSV